MTKILLLAANPKDNLILQSNIEIREIDHAIHTAKFGAQFELVPKVAVRLKDLAKYLEEVKPDIVHFSGHGNTSSEIVLEDDYGNSHPVSKEALREIFSLLRGNIRCVVLNACYAEPQANAIAEDIDCVVGMLNPILDTAAIDFAREFYRQLADGKDVGTAFRLARAQIPDGPNLARLHAFKATSALEFVKEKEKRSKGKSTFRTIGVIVGTIATVTTTILLLYLASIEQFTNFLFPSLTETPLLMFAKTPEATATPLLEITATFPTAAISPTEVAIVPTKLITIEYIASITSTLAETLTSSVASTNPLISSEPVAETTRMETPMVVRLNACEATVIPSGGTIVVARDSAYQGSSEKSRIRRGTIVNVVEVSPNISIETWYLVQDLNGRELGWVLSKDVALSSECHL